MHIKANWGHTFGLLGIGIGFTACGETITSDQFRNPVQSGGSASSASGGASASPASGGSQVASGGGSQAGLGGIPNVGSGGASASPASGGAQVASGGMSQSGSGGAPNVGSGGAVPASGVGGMATSLGGTFNDGVASPPVPPDLVTYVTGSDADANVAPTGPGLILMGGGTDVTAAFEWWNGLIGQGDIVVLRTTGADGYNSYLHGMGGSDSVETLLVTTQDLANSDYVRYRISHAEGIFMAGGDQSTYINLWKGTAVQEALRIAFARGAVIGGTSAGLAVLGEFVYPAFQGSAVSADALADPFASDIVLDRGFLEFPALKGVITDSHFSERDRFGRLVTFVARTLRDGWATASFGVGVSEGTAIVIDRTGLGTVLGSNNAYIVEGAKAPEQCEAGQSLTFKALRYARLQPNDTLQFPLSAATPLPLKVSAEGGNLSPSSPY